MPRFKIIVTRDTTESVVITVEADSAAGATHLALEKSRERNADWNQDENFPQPGYVTDIVEIP